MIKSSPTNKGERVMFRIATVFEVNAILQASLTVVIIGLVPSDAGLF